MSMMKRFRREEKENNKWKVTEGEERIKRRKLKRGRQLTEEMMEKR